MARTESHSGLASRGIRVVMAGALASSMAFVSVGCNNAAEGAMSGAALGALAGLGIGALSGNEGDGAAIGAISGAVGGAVLGDQNARNERYSRNRRSDW
jgi:outer membrane lipoprotein SlyB